jgi:1-acyl-sn-glycerol-3-phosphate acyltransferase
MPLMDREATGGKRPRNGNGNGNGHSDAATAREAARRAADAIAGRVSEDEPEPGAAGSALGALGNLATAPARLSRSAAKAVMARVPAADLDERDPDYIRESLPGLWLLASIYFRAEVRGLGNIPEDGPVLLVGNHSGGNMTPDTGVFTLAFSTYFGVERPFYQLAHNLVLSMPGLGILRRYGTVAASPENARTALRSGAAVLVYPGGDYEVHRPIWERNRIDFDGRKGWLRLALQENVPIVPVVAVGGQETSIFLSRGEWLARALNLDRLFRLKVLPISLALPWGLNIGDMLGHVPLPAKITVEALPPIDLREEFGEDPDLDEAYAHVLRLMQETLDALAAERRLPIVG